VSADYLDYNGGSAGVAGSASDRWSGFGDSSYAYDYSDGFGEITVGELQENIRFWISNRFKLDKNHFYLKNETFVSFEAHFYRYFIFFSSQI